VETKMKNLFKTGIYDGILAIFKKARMEEAAFY